MKDQQPRDYPRRNLTGSGAVSGKSKTAAGREPSFEVTIFLVLILTIRQFSSALTLPLFLLAVKSHGIMLQRTKKDILNRNSSTSVDLNSAERVYLDARLAETLRHVGPAHYLRLVIFLFLYVATAFAAIWIAQRFQGRTWVYLANIPFYVFAAASLHGISLFTHEGVHGTLSVHAWWNRALSIACALPVLQNYSAYKVLHLRHHHHLGQEGDPDHYANYTSWT